MLISSKSAKKTSSFAAIAGSIREKKQKWIIQGTPLMDILVKYVFELKRTCPNYWWKKVLPPYCHLTAIDRI